MRHEHDNLKAGLFVLVGIVLALGAVLVLSDLEKLIERKRSVTVIYGLNEGLRGLKEGAAVTLGDVPVGTVREIEDVFDQTGRVISKQVSISIPAHYQLAADAVIELKAPLIGTGTTLNIRSVGQGEPYDPGSTIKGVVPGQFVEQFGIGPPQREQLRAIIANVESITTQLREDLPHISAKLRSAVARVDAIMANAASGVSDLRAAAADVKAIVADVGDRRKGWLEHVDHIAESADQMVAGVRDLVRDKDPALRSTIDNIEDITSHVRGRTLAQVEEALATATSALGNAETATKELKAVVIGQRPVLERALANAQITTDQLKLAAIEVRRSPWRLLYEPDDEELETDNLYDAARSFALAAGTLDATAQSLSTFAARSPDDTSRIQEMLDYLETLFGKFQEAEQAFWEALRPRRPPSGP